MGEMYDTTTTTTAPSCTNTVNNNSHNSNINNTCLDDISVYLQHLVNSSTSSTTPQQFHHHANLINELDYYNSRSFNPNEASGGFEFSSGGGGGGGGGSDVGGPAVKRRKGQLENDLDEFDCESEEGLEVSDGPSRSAPSRSSSKRSRAAEVHNLSEKRRRSRINEKMKALQNLIPNSNKTDKASMLDEAIEYLKTLQVQVQLLSMKNGMSLHPMYLPGVMSPDARMSFGEGIGLQTHTTDIEMSKLPLNQESTAQTSYGLSKQCSTSQQPVVVPNLITMTNPERSYGVSPTMPIRQGPFQELYRGGILPQQRQLPSHSTRNPADNGARPVAAESLSFGVRSQQPNDIKHMDRSQNVDTNQIFLEHLHSLQTGRSMLNGDGRLNTMNF